MSLYYTFRIRREDSVLRVPPIVLKSIGYVVEIVGSDLVSDDSLLVGTAFIVTLPSDKLSNYRHSYLVTAKHVLQEKPNTKTVVLVNQKEGSTKPLAVHSWHKHPDPRVDLAVGLFIYDPSNDDISTFGLEDSFDDTAREPYGVGDEVFFPGLFHLSASINSVVPIVRHGNVAMLPREDIQVEGAFSRVYLVEARSTGGISGSPVWVRETIGVRATRDDGSYVEVKGAGNMKLLGLIQGHWDIKDSELNRTAFETTTKGGVNLGIAIVVPAFKILEFLNTEMFVTLRHEIEAERIKNFGISNDGDRLE